MKALTLQRVAAFDFANVDDAVLERAADPM
jgi:hypothetical protein